MFHRSLRETTVTATQPPDAAPPTAMTNRQILQAMSVMAGMFVAILAGTVVANALPTIIADLGASQSAYTWVVTAELLAMTATVPLWGKLSDLFDKKLLLQLSLGMLSSWARSWRASPRVSNCSSSAVSCRASAREV
ncbi:hypothetical protein SALBM217S_02936 [Streptomyces griseoloalbus]